jgi:hypothetical protein
MITKLYLIIFIISISYSSVHSQSPQSTAYGQYNYAQTKINELNTVENSNDGSSINLSEVDGSPYENASFQAGTVSNKKLGDSKSLYFRYNVFNNIIEMKENMADNYAVAMIKSLDIYVTMNNREYHYEIYSNDKNNETDEGYFILVSKEENVSIYLKKMKRFHDEKKATTPNHHDIPARFKDMEDTYYLKKNGERILFPISTKSKKLLMQLSDQETKIKIYLKTEKIKLNNEKDLIKLFKYYDSLI